MTHDTPATTVQLQPPGKGLPFLEQILSHYVLLPLACTVMSNKEAIETLVIEGQTMVRWIEAASEEEIQSPVLIPKITGIEDSSRYWSALMTLEHLNITSNLMAKTIEALTRGEQSALPVARVEAVKPHTELQKEKVIQAYQLFLNTYPDKMNSLVPHFSKENRHQHPWFWKLNAHEWLCINALHHRIHKKQVKLILRSFHKTEPH
ncbi:MAG: hypothetical protein K2X66_16455 [Cyanobacteria bacterium]|nr:hypothetical protein [Cyanobacteriota bacterium]